MKSKKTEESENLRRNKHYRRKEFFKEKIELVELEAQFGLILREKNDHKNYVLLNFTDLEDVVSYFEIFKKVF